MPRVLDLFCGAGGASKGYVDAGYEVVGVDIKPQPHYPYTFIQADAMDFPLHALDWTSGSFDLIHASPPCQRYSTMTKRWGDNTHPDLIEPLRLLLEDSGIPYVIENVPGSPLIDPILLCGEMFNLFSGEFRLRRHRLFETSFRIKAPDHPKHIGRALGVYGNTGGKSIRDGIVFPKVADWKVGMEIDWMTSGELKEAIPPAYTRWIGSVIRGLT